jgi:ABC-type transporter MlaC component
MPPQIDIPQLDGESRQAYAARVEYLTMGESRSHEAVAQKYSKSVGLMARWSSRYNWQAHARAYDQTLATLAVQQHAAQYLADLADHRERYSRAGRALFQVATSMLADLNQQRAAIKPNGNTLATVSRALTIAADLEAHALGLDQLMEQLTPEDAP